MTALTDDTAVVAVEDTLSTTLEGETVILHTGTGKYYGFNNVGTEVWKTLDEPMTLTALSRTIASQYDISEERSRSDIETLLAELLEKDLVEVVGE